MAHKIDYLTIKGSDAAYAKIKSVITPEYAQKFQVKADVAYDDAKKVIKSTGAGFTLTLSFFDTYCEADLDLSLLLRALKSKILAKVVSEVSKNV
jgi:hypothetical protein